MNKNLFAIHLPSSFGWLRGLSMCYPRCELLHVGTRPTSMSIPQGPHFKCVILIWGYLSEFWVSTSQKCNRQFSYYLVCGCISNFDVFSLEFVPIGFAFSIASN